MSGDKIRELEEQLAALRSQWPAHSVSPAMLLRLDELEDALEQERMNLSEGQGAADSAASDE
jgi:hypothetical protein